MTIVDSDNSGEVIIAILFKTSYRKKNDHLKFYIFYTHQYL